MPLSTEQRLKYLDFVDIHADLDDNDRQLYTQLSSERVLTTKTLDEILAV